jgi:hypothetical protein
MGGHIEPAMFSAFFDHTCAQHQNVPSTARNAAA